MIRTGWRPLAASVALGLALGWWTSCAAPATFVCSSDSECVGSGRDGQCEPSGYCSFPDDDCPSGFRFPSDAGQLAGECTQPVMGTGSDTGRGSSSDGGEAETSGSGAALDETGSSTGAADSTGALTSSGSSETSSDPACGNALVDPGEDCEPGAPIRLECADIDQGGGPLGCAEDCTWDTSACVLCGDGTLAAPELCDGADLGGVACDDLGFVAGTLACNRTCSAFDPSACMGVVCGSDPGIPAEPCPPACTSCNDIDGCLIECSGSDECEGEDIVCPDGWPCTLRCEQGACGFVNVQCPPFHACTVTCQNNGSCGQINVECGAVGTCTVDCSNNACVLANVDCGGDRCDVSCSDEEEVQIQCGASCDCTGNCPGPD
ncbi:MAG: hypothetical protein AAF721_01270 [Myxococcota bacterium]